MLAALLDTHALGRGLLWGSAALLGSAVLALAWRRGRRPAVLGVPAAVAALVAVRAEPNLTPADHFVPWSVFAALALLAAGGLVAARMSRWRAPIAYVPGCVVLGLSSVPGLAEGTRVTVAVATFAAAVLLADFEQAHERDGFAVLLFAVSATVPAHLIHGGTVPGAVLLGASIPMVVAALPRPLARLGPSGTACLAASYFWVTALVADNRVSRLAAACAGLGFLAFEPVNRMFTRPSGRHGDHRRRPRQLDDSRLVVLAVALLAQGLVGAYVMLVTARQATDLALLSVLPLAAAGVVVGRAIVPSPRRWGRSRHRETP